jgi:hypothetical protein
MIRITRSGLEFDGKPSRARATLLYKYKKANDRMDNASFDGKPLKADPVSDLCTKRRPYSGNIMDVKCGVILFRERIKNTNAKMSTKTDFR